MGEVYRARDTRLDRTVAIKVLPAGAAAREELRQRFEREARTISSLNHPHICALYDVGQQDGTDFLVMEYLEGETLAHRLHRGPLPPEQVLRLGREIADALDKAHRQRIVHRDLKPANIMLTKAGVKLMDFGLAKLIQKTSPVVETLSRMTTQDSRITEEGLIVGTFQYMAPEQLEGREADPRSDIFALGTVLYEMATGRAAFQGKTRASLIAAILSSEPPPMAQLQPLTPPALDRLVRACLVKDPDERIQTAHDVLLQLKWIAEAGSEAGVPAPVAGRRKVRERLAWALATVFLVTTVTAIVGYLRRAPQPGSAVRFEIGPPASTSFGDWIAQRVSPDGRMIAFGAQDVSGQPAWWVRALDSFETRRLVGVGGFIFTPVWSPDSRTLVWVDESKVRRIDITGGPSEIVCSVQTQGGVTVNGEEIFLANSPKDGPLLRFAANHCAPEEATKLDRSKHFSHAWPFFLPDGRHFLYSALAADKNHQIWAASLDSPEARLVLQNASRPAYVEPGYLLFSRHGILLAQPFDWKSMRVSGEAVRLQEEQLMFTDLYGMANFSASDTGVLVYQLQPEMRSQLYWFDRGGRQLAAVFGEPEALADTRLSPDGKNLIAARYDPSTHMSDLWMYRLDRATWTRLTSSPIPGSQLAVWSPDGSRIVYGALPPSGPPQSNLYTVSSSGGSSEPLLETGEDKVPTDWSPDGRFVLFELYRLDAGADLWLLEVATGKLSPLVQARADQVQGRFSPDGNSLAYVSNESGRPEVYLQAVTGGSRIQVSTGGGSRPRWRHDGREIYYTTPDSKLMVADFTPTATHDVGVPRVLFTLPRGADYDVARDGRFLVNLPLITPAQNRLSVVVNWPAELKKK
jgi:Tol biopolymer transport system component/predicted Ser/Thr protein kinase